jgi:hypothetical protein
MARRALFLATFAVGHMLLTLFATVSAVGSVLLGTNDPAAAVSPTIQRFWYFTSQVLLFPLGTIAPSELPGAWGAAVLFANGVLWALAWRWLVTRQHRMSSRV